MGRTRRDCPVFGCGSRNLARLANHLDQVHVMKHRGTQEMVKVSEIGICVPRQSEESKEFNVEKRLENLLERQEEMERNSNVYLQNSRLKHGDNSERKTNSEVHKKWLAF